MSCFHFFLWDGPSVAMLSHTKRGWDQIRAHPQIHDGTVVGFHIGHWHFWMVHHSAYMILLVASIAAAVPDSYLSYFLWYFLSTSSHKHSPCCPIAGWLQSNTLITSVFPRATGWCGKHGPTGPWDPLLTLRPISDGQMVSKQSGVLGQVLWRWRFYSQL